MYACTYIMIPAGWPMTNDSHTTMFPYCVFFSTLCEKWHDFDDMMITGHIPCKLGRQQRQWDLHDHRSKEPQLEHMERYADQELVEESR